MTGLPWWRRPEFWRGFRRGAAQALIPALLMLAALILLMLGGRT